MTGVVHPDRVLTNAGGRAGDVLVLSKPLGAGVCATAVKRGVDPDGLIERATAVMCELNRDAAAAALAAGAHALTDVTGFGLLGHLHELAEASGLAAEVYAATVPAIDGVHGAAGRQGRRDRRGNAAQSRPRRDASPPSTPTCRRPRRWLACDAMTSGGLLAAVSPEHGDEAMGTVIGRLVEGPAGAISVL